MKNNKIYNDRELSQAEKAQIVGFYRQSKDVLVIAGIMELKEVTVENVLKDYFGRDYAKSV